MNPRTTAILFVVAAALAAAIRFLVIPWDEARKEAADAEKHLFPGLEQDAIDSIQLSSPDAPSVHLERHEGHWQIVEPIRFPADTFAADGLASALAQLVSEATIEDPSAPEVYGLDTGGEVRFSAAGSEELLRTGSEAPRDSSSYAAVEGRDAVYVVKTYRIKSLHKSLDTLRDKTIASFDTAAVRRVSASWPTGRVVVERGDEGWQLISPPGGDADAKTLEDLLSDLSVLSAEGFVDEPGPEATASFESPEFAIEIEFEADGEAPPPEPVKLAVGALDADGSHRLVRASQTSLYTIPAATLDDLPRRVNAYRDRQIADFASLDAKRLEVGFHSDTGETVTITAVRGADGWESSPQKFAGGKLGGLVSELSRLRAADILADEMGTAELQAVELDPPRSVFRVFGEGEGEAAALLAEVQLGALRAEGIVARSPDRKTIFQLDPNLADRIPVSLEAFESRFVATPEAEATESGEEDQLQTPDPTPAL